MAASFIQQMGDRGKDHVVRLEFPAEPKMLLVARMTLSGVCVRCGMGLDTIEDVRIAADEACYCLTHQRTRVDTLCMSCGWDDSRLMITFESITDSSDAPVNDASALNVEEIPSGFPGSAPAIALRAGAEEIPSGFPGSGQARPRVSHMAAGADYVALAQSILETLASSVELEHDERGVHAIRLTLDESNRGAH